MSLIIEIKVIPQSGKTGLFVDKSGIVKCHLKAAPEKGKANKELVDVVAKTIGIKKGLICVVSGATSRKKLVKIEGDITYQQFLEALQSGVQKKLF